VEIAEAKAELDILVGERSKMIAGEFSMKTKEKIKKKKEIDYQNAKEGLNNLKTEHEN